jgi:hypothetical protein
LLLLSPCCSTKGLSAEELLVYQVIKQAGNTGVWTRDLKVRTNLAQPQVTKMLKALEGKSLIKSVKNVNNPSRKLYMLFELEPSREITGGAWCVQLHLLVSCVRNPRLYMLFDLEQSCEITCGAWRIQLHPMAGWGFCFRSCTLECLMLLIDLRNPCAFVAAPGLLTLNALQPSPASLLLVSIDMCAAGAPSSSWTASTSRCCSLNHGRDQASWLRSILYAPDATFYSTSLMFCLVFCVLQVH